MADYIDVPVVIVGGGGCGLSLSIFLSNYHIEHVLFERHPSTSFLPKAHYLNQRTMEIFREHGVASAIRSLGCPIHHMSRTQWRTSLGGSRSFDGRVIGSVPAFGGQVGTPDYETYRNDSAELSSNLPLLRLEPVLRDIASERNPGKVLFSHEVQEIVQEPDHVLVHVRDAEGNLTRYRSQFLVGADGGKTVGPQIGVQMEGPKKIVDFVSTHFKADLSAYWDDRTLICHFINPEGESMVHFDCGALVQMGPTWGRNSEEWTLHFGFPVTDSKRFDTDALPDRIRHLLKIPDLQMEVLRVSHWELERTLATKYQEGRIFVAGDAAHKRPPTTGLGLNTAIEDALNLAWKLALVVKDQADISLVNTYEAERRPVGLRNCDWGLFTFSNMPVLQAAVGLLPNSLDYNINRFERIFEDSEYGRNARHQIQRIISTQDVEFAAHNIELGFVYEQGAVVPDGTATPNQDPGGRLYEPTTRPGSRLPHAWIEMDAHVISTHDLVGSGRFLLLTDEAGCESWKAAANAVSQSSGAPLTVEAIKAYSHTKRTDCFFDHDDMWVNLRGHEDGGVLLVRPDNFVAWRSSRLPHDPSGQLLQALMSVCGRAAPT
ncbi:FAD binding domain-containing protein [Teratosphaeria destructans]|uniref:FAD binding domain-containing protein n=1 Tax=Teratosphaeria destructans TaxID=418781 RepID=A0A9W7SL49_9PEZI|nr:FAD binding domain-containing protein [Teratosphaeria destructans]